MFRNRLNVCLAGDIILEAAFLVYVQTSRLSFHTLSDSLCDPRFVFLAQFSCEPGRYVQPRDEQSLLLVQLPISFSASILKISF